MSRHNAPQLPFGGDDAAGRVDVGDLPQHAPCIYVATKITGTKAGSDEHQRIEFAAETINSTLIECAANATPPWQVRVHVAVDWTSPNKTPDWSPRQVFQCNARHVIMETDALVVYGVAPSAGVGQEFTWATQLGLPVLYLEPSGHPPSRQIAGTPGDVTIASGDSALLKEEVRGWLRAHRHQIETNPGRRAGRRDRFEQTHRQLVAAWRRVGANGRHSTAGQLGVTPDLIEWWLSEVDFLAAIPAVHLLTLSVVLTNSTDAVVGRHELSLGELEALITARHEYGWSDGATDSLRRRGERELARPAVRRFKLDTPDDWYRLHEATQP